MPLLRKNLKVVVCDWNGTWKKEDELKQLKSEVAALERKIQLTLTTPEPTNKEGSVQKQETVAPVIDDRNFTKEHIIIARPKPPTQEASKGFKI